MAGVTEFAARHLPLARATSLESWLDLSGAPTCAPDFLRAGAMHVPPAAVIGRDRHIALGGPHFL
jgi:hypothetical protein